MGDKAKEVLAQGKEKAIDLKEIVFDRAEDLGEGTTGLGEQAREILAEGRQKAENIQDNLLSRAKDELK